MELESEKGWTEDEDWQQRLTLNEMRRSGGGERRGRGRGKGGGRGEVRQAQGQTGKTTSGEGSMSRPCFASRNEERHIKGTPTMQESDLPTSPV